MDIRSLRELEGAFKALSNINRLKLLVQLQTPKGYNEIELTPSRPGKGASKDRPISRQAVRSHIEELRELGVVTETADDARRRRFVVDRPRLYAIVERMRELTTVEPTVEPDDRTLEMTDAPRVKEPEGPHLALVRGVEEGRMFPLSRDAEEEGEASRFTIGRRSDVDVPLTYDGFISGQHAVVVSEPGGCSVKDLPENKNGTFLNWRRLKEGAVAPLSPGDVIGVGRSLLVFRE